MVSMTFNKEDLRETMLRMERREGGERRRLVRPESDRRASETARMNREAAAA